MGLLEMLSGVADKAIGKGHRGAFARGLLGMELPEDVSPSERDTYRNAVALTNTPTPLALAAAPAAIIKATKAAPRAEALETARKNAVKMLGLPENNTAMDRARALGFDADVFHGRKGDFETFDKSLSGRSTGTKGVSRSAVDVTNDPSVAGDYALNAALPEAHELKNVLSSIDRTSKKMFGMSPGPEKDALLGEWSRLRARASEINEMPGVSGFGLKSSIAGDRANIMPLMVRSSGLQQVSPQAWSQTTRRNALKAAADAGADGVTFQNVPDVLEAFKPSSYLHDTTSVLNPAAIRSRFAAFDPARVNENDLLGRADPRLLALIAAGASVPVGYGLLGGLGERGD